MPITKWEYCRKGMHGEFARATHRFQLGCVIHHLRLQFKESLPFLIIHLMIVRFSVDLEMRYLHKKVVPQGDSFVVKLSQSNSHK